MKSNEVRERARRSPWLRAVPWLLAGLLLLRLLSATRSFDGLYGQDAYEYLRYAEAVAVWLGGGPEPGSFFWPIGYPLVSALLSAVVSHFGFGVIAAAQLVSMVSGASCVLALALAVRRFGGSAAGAAVAAAATAVSGVLWLSSVSVMSDALAVALVSWSLAIVPARSALATGAQGVLLSLVVLVRWVGLAAAAGAVSVVWVGRSALDTWRRRVALLAGLVIPCAVAWRLGLSGAGFGLSNNRARWSLENLWATNVDGALAELRLPTLGFYLLSPAHPLVLGAFVLIPLVFALSAGWQWFRGAGRTAADLRVLLCLLAVGLIVLVASGYPLRNPRFILVALPFLVVALGLCFDGLTRARARQLRALPLPLALAALLINGWFAETRLRERIDLKRAELSLVAAVQAVIDAERADREGARERRGISVFASDSALLLDRYGEFDVVNLYLADNRELAGARPGDLLVLPARRRTARSRQPSDPFLDRKAAGIRSLEGRFALRDLELVTALTSDWRVRRIEGRRDASAIDRDSAQEGS